MPAREAIQKVRELLPVSDPWKPFWSAAHYDAFKRGPAYGMSQLIDENAHDTGGKALDRPRADYLNRIFSKELFHRLTELSKSRTGKSITQGFTSLREGLGYQGDTLSLEDQEKVLGGLRDSSLFSGRDRGAFGQKKPDAFKDEFDRVVKETANGVREHSLPAYQQLGDVIRNLHTGASTYLPAILGAGALGLGGAGLYNLLKQPKKKPEEITKTANMSPLTLTLCKIALNEADVDRLIPDNLNLQGKGSEALLMPGAYRTAGRAAGLAESLGNEVPMTVKHPRTTRWLLQTMGLGLGMTAGGVVGSALGKGENGMEDAKLGLGGMGLGGLLGYAGSSLYDSRNRREQVKEVKEKAKQDLRAGEYASPAIGQGSLLSSLVSGVHQQGRADTAETIALGKKNFKGNPGMAASQLLGLSPLTMIGSILNTGEARGRINNATPQAVRQIA
jgi:hypothetical protein